MNSFQSQVLDPSPAPLDVPRAPELLLSPELCAQLAPLLPPGLALVPDSKASKQVPKRASVAPSRPEPPTNEKRPAYKIALNKISSNADHLGRCIEILAAMKRHPKVRPFLQPVDPIALGIPDYFSVVKEPMDLSTINKNLESGVYSAFEDFDAHMQKMFENALTYNKPGSNVHRLAEELRAYYGKLVNDKSGGLSSKGKKPNRPAEGGSRLKVRPPNTVPQPLTLPEKNRLSDLIKNKLPAENLIDVWKIVSNGEMIGDSEIDLDIDKLSPRVARELEAFVYEKTSQTNKRKKTKADPPVKSSFPKPAVEPKAQPGQNATANTAWKGKWEAQKDQDSMSDSSYLSNSDSDESS